MDRLCFQSDKDSVQSGPDYYEILQVNPNAEPETIHRVYRLLAQRAHPDNAETGNEEQFRVLNEAYQVLGDPERRAKYDVVHAQQREGRWKLASSSQQADNDFEDEQIVRLTVLEVLYTQRRMEPEKPALAPLDLEKLTGRPREHLEFTIWYLVQKKYLSRTDSSLLAITVEGAEYLEKNHRENLLRRRLNPAPVTT